MSKVIIACDPGSSGGFAIQHSDGTVMVHKMPDSPREICELIESEIERHWRHHVETSGESGEEMQCVMEEVGGYIGGAGAPGSAMFNFGMGYGVIQGILTAFRIPYTLVRPQRWQKALGLGNKEKERAERVCGLVTPAEAKRISLLNAAHKRDWKNKLKQRAEREYPHLKVTLANCDALLILSYAKQQP